MNICDKKAGPTPVPGRLYEHDGDGEIYIASATNDLVSLTDGGRWSSAGGFGTFDTHLWEDVTDQYCLRRAGENHAK